MSELKLVYVDKIGKNSNGVYEYDLFFSETPDVVWGENWEIQCPSICGNIAPDPSTYNDIKRIHTNFDFFCAQQNSCFSMQDCIDGCIGLMWFYNNDYEAVVFNFGEDIESVNEKLIENGIIYNEPE